MRSSKMATGSGRIAIFHHHHNRDRKKYPKSWLTSFPVPPSWIQDGGATSNVWRTSRCLWRHPWKGSKNVPQTSDFTESIWSLASPRHYPSDRVSCPWQYKVMHQTDILVPIMQTPVVHTNYHPSSEFDTTPCHEKECETMTDQNLFSPFPVHQQ